MFYGGKPPKGIKTNWIMHEYRLADNSKSTNMKPPGCDMGNNKKGSLRVSIYDSIGFHNFGIFILLYFIYLICNLGLII